MKLKKDLEKSFEKGDAKIYNVPNNNFAAYANFFEQNDLEELVIEEKGTKIEFRKAGAAAPVAQPVFAAAPAPAMVESTAPTAVEAPNEAAPAAAAEPAADDSNLDKITSPLNGTFYSSPSPEAANFVAVGSVVSPGSVLCIVEAMKIFNEIKSDVSGKVAKILVKNGDAVKEDQPLFLIEPA